MVDLRIHRVAESQLGDEDSACAVQTIRVPSLSLAGCRSWIRRRDQSPQGQRHEVVRAFERKVQPRERTRESHDLKVHPSRTEQRPTHVAKPIGEPLAHHETKPIDSVVARRLLVGIEQPHHGALLERDGRAISIDQSLYCGRQPYTATSTRQCKADQQKSHAA